MSIFTALVLLVGFFSQAALAGGIDNKQNWSAKYIATGSRNAATDGPDIAAYNPAGIMYQEDGIGLGVDGQYIFKNYKHQFINYPNGPMVTRDQDEPSIIPGLFATYKSGNWGVFGSVTNNGGGGLVKYASGNTITNDLRATVPAPMPLRPPIGPSNILTYSQDKIQAESYYITYTMGGSYQINPKFSVAAGLRYMDASKDLEAYVSNVPWYNTIYVAYEEEADGWGWIASVNFKPREDLLLAVRYESKVELEFETDLNEKNHYVGNGFLERIGKTQGAKSNRDLPAVLGFGASWDAMDRLNLNTSFTYYLEKDADWDGQELLVDNSWDFAISATWRFLENLRGNIGYMYTDVGMNAKDFGLTEKMSPVLDAHSFFFGFGYDIRKNITIDLGVMTNFYREDTELDAIGNPVTYDKQNNAVSLGLAFKF
jgi:long-chain fatty acid transport protein